MTSFERLTPLGVSTAVDPDAVQYKLHGRDRKPSPYQPQRAPLYRELFPEVVLGLSDHTTGHSTVLGAVALGAHAVEKHFPDGNSRSGPDHGFSMTPQTWREMVDRTRELELALGSPVKRVAENEQDTVVIQRRALRASRDLQRGAVFAEDDVQALRPAPLDGIFPYDRDKVIGRRLTRDVAHGQHLTWAVFE